MTELTSPAPAVLRTQERRKLQRRIAVLVGVILLAILLVLKPPFVIRPLPGRVQAGSQPAQSAAAKFVDPIWATKVLPTIQEKAQDIAKILPEMSQLTVIAI